MSDNRLGGPIPWTGAAAFPSAPKVIDLSSNSLTGAVPAELAGAEELLLHNNSLSGPLPGASGALRRLVAHGNRLSGPLPPLGNASALQELSLADNMLAGGLGPLPASVVRIALQHNPSLGGTLPPQVRRGGGRAHARLCGK